MRTHLYVAEKFWKISEEEVDLREEIAANKKNLKKGWRNGTITILIDW